MNLLSNVPLVPWRKGLLTFFGRVTEWRFRSAEWRLYQDERFHIFKSFAILNEIFFYIFDSFFVKNIGKINGSNVKYLLLRTFL